MCVGGLGPGGTRGSAQLAYVSVTVLVPYTYVPNPVIYMLTVPYTRSSIRNALAIYCYNALHNKIRSLDFDCNNEMKQQQQTPPASLANHCASYFGCIGAVWIDEMKQQQTVPRSSTRGACHATTRYDHQTTTPHASWREAAPALVPLVAAARIVDGGAGTVREEERDDERRHAVGERPWCTRTATLEAGRLGSSGGPDVEEVEIIPRAGACGPWAACTGRRGSPPRPCSGLGGGTTTTMWSSTFTVVGTPTAACRRPYPSTGCSGSRGGERAGPGPRCPRGRWGCRSVAWRARWRRPRTYMSFIDQQLHRAHGLLRHVPDKIIYILRVRTSNN